VRRNGSPSLEESSADICVVGAGISAAIQAAWSLEQHDNAERHEPFDSDHVHYVPLGSLTPPVVDYLVAAKYALDLVRSRFWARCGQAGGERGQLMPYESIVPGGMHFSW
jgi:hypothetical protein